MSYLVAFHYRSYGTFFLQQNRLHKIHRGFTHYKYYRAKVFDRHQTLFSLPPIILKSGNRHNYKQKSRGGVHG